MFWSLDLGIWIICHKSSSKNKLCIQVGQIVYSTLCIALQISATDKTRAMAMRSSILNVQSISHPKRESENIINPTVPGQACDTLGKIIQPRSIWDRWSFEVFKNGRFSVSIDAGFQKTSTLCEFTNKWGNWRPSIFITPTERCFHWLRLMVRPSTVLVSHIVSNFWTPAMTKPCLFCSLFQVKSAKKSSATKKKRLTAWRSALA